MKVIIIIAIVIGIFLTMSTGCSKQTEIKREKIEVVKHVGSEDEYEQFKEVTDDQRVKEAKKIINNIAWESKIVSMIRPPDYKFAFLFESSKADEKTDTYELWIGPNKDRLELVVDAEGQYSHLESDESAELLEIITGTKFSKFK